MPAHPIHALTKLLQGRPLTHPVDGYPSPWGELLELVRSTPPLPRARLAALQDGLAALPDAALDGLQESLLDPAALAPSLRLNPNQRQLLGAVRLLGPVQCGALAEFLGRDRSNTFHSLQALVSQNRLVRRKRGRSIYYSIPHLIMRRKPPAP